MKRHMCGEQEEETRKYFDVLISWRHFVEVETFVKDLINRNHYQIYPNKEGRQA